ncbi:MAG: glycoside hydrolase family 2 TIM barrel-domain containing protein [Candidatus Sulfopaludibacter sp.]|nr:glycoside hydrolase family 2 TIM barrel-domain containing protein [Candidatus Sulfopaludibacter sp.]
MEKVYPTRENGKVNRRSFLIASTAAAALADAQTAPSAVPSRRVYSLNRNWLFGGKMSAGADAPGFDDTRFRRVTLPHTNVELPWHSFDDKAYEFVSIYRRHFRAPAAWHGKRVFVDFGGAMTAAKVTINGHGFEEYRGGYTPFSFELTPHLKYGVDNLLAVELDSTERADIPPFGGTIDYLTFGGIYRDVELRVVPQTHLANLFAKPVRVLESGRAVVARCYLEGPLTQPVTITAELRDGDRVVKSASRTASAPAEYHDIMLEDLGDIQLWSLVRPKLYQVTARLDNGDRLAARTGFREARFTDKGFFLNGEHVKLRGLNRHQTYPYTGGAMPARVQAADARVLRKELKCNIVRTSHYPQSPAFLDACDELGLLALEEIPGWQHIGDQAWQDLAVDNTARMIRRDWNHPSIVLWGVRINESPDNHAFYTRTNEVAHKLDDSRQTGGIRNRYDSELLEDVFTMNDFGFPLRPPNHPMYLNTEFNGHMFSTKRFDQVDRVAEHTIRHVRVHNQLASADGYAGGIAWCAFDYASHRYFGSGDRICYHGVSDIFRLPKPAAGFYKSQCDPAEEVVIEPGFFYAWGDRGGGNGPGMVPICSNCDHLKIYYNGKLRLELDPDRTGYPHLKYPPFLANLTNLSFATWGDLKIEGYLAGKLAATKSLSGEGTDDVLVVKPDDLELNGDGRDATRVVLAATDRFGNPRPFASGAIQLSVSGPGEIIGENPFSLSGGAGAVWVKAKDAPGTIRLEARHQYLGKQTVEIRVRKAEPEWV